MGSYQTKKLNDGVCGFRRTFICEKRPLKKHILAFDKKLLFFLYTNEEERSPNGVQLVPTGPSGANRTQMNGPNSAQMNPLE